MSPSTLLAIPNVSEGRDPQTIAAIGARFAGGVDGGVRTLDVHCDPDHHRSVFTLVGQQGGLAGALLSGARVAVEEIDVVRAGHDRVRAGQHPHVGAVDVAPIVYLDPRARGAACAEALLLAERIGQELEVPVFLYGELTASGQGPARTRAELRRGGVTGLAARMAGANGADGEAALTPDFGPPRMHPTAGATLVAARPPLVAFNLQLAPPATIDDARRVAALIREGGEHGLPGLRAIGIELSLPAAGDRVAAGRIAQVSMNVERPFELSLAEVVTAVRAHAAVESAELVGLAPATAFDRFPEDLPIPGFDPARHLLENALGAEGAFGSDGTPGAGDTLDVGS